MGVETGYDRDTFTLTGASTFTYTGTRTFVAANGDKLFSAITGKGTFTRTRSAGGLYRPSMASSRQ